jgi:hypothetical protein
MNIYVNGPRPRVALVMKMLREKYPICKDFQGAQGGEALVPGISVDDRTNTGGFSRGVVLLALGVQDSLTKTLT